MQVVFASEEVGLKQYYMQPTVDMFQITLAWALLGLENVRKFSIGGIWAAIRKPTSMDPKCVSKIRIGVCRNFGDLLLLTYLLGTEAIWLQMSFLNCHNWSAVLPPLQLGWIDCRDELTSLRVKTLLPHGIMHNASFLKSSRRMVYHILLFWMKMRGLLSRLRAFDMALRHIEPDFIYTSCSEEG